MESTIVALATLVFFASFGLNAFYEKRWLVITAGVSALVIALISLLVLILQ